MRSKQRIKRLYDDAKLSLSPAVQELMFEHGMERNEALNFLLFGAV